MRERERKDEREREKECVYKKEKTAGRHRHTGTEKKGALSLSHRVWIERRVSIGYFIIAKG